MSKIYYQERNHPNWTGRVPRQARITGEWSTTRRRSIPVADVIAVILLGLVIVGMMFI